MLVSTWDRVPVAGSGVDKGALRLPAELIVCLFAVLAVHERDEVRLICLPVCLLCGCLLGHLADFFLHFSQHALHPIVTIVATSVEMLSHPGLKLGGPLEVGTRQVHFTRC